MKKTIKVLLLSFIPSILSTGFAYAKTGSPKPASPSEAEPDYAEIDYDWEFEYDIETFSDKTFGFILRKVSDDGVLNGAIFRLYYSMEDAVYNEDPMEFLMDESEKVYTACPDSDFLPGGPLTYDITAGTATIDGLYSGTYYLGEILPPDGYEKIHNPYQIIINDEGVVYSREMLSEEVFPEEAAGGLITIWNHKAAETMPSTGGPGKWPFYIAGLGCMSAALYLALHMKRSGRGGKNA